MSGDIEQVKIENIPHLTEEANDQLKFLSDHVIENPFLKGKRTLTIKVDIEPKFNQQTGLNLPEITLSVKRSVPTSKLPMVTGYAINGQIRINPKDPCGPCDIQTVIPGTGDPERVEVAR